MNSFNANEGNVSDFYNSGGWSVDNNGDTSDAYLFEDLRPSSRKYVSDCRKKIYSLIPRSGDLMLDMASGPIQYPEYLNYSRNFNKRYCIDLSSDALQQAEKKLGDKGVYICDSFFNVDIKPNTFDLVLSLHTIYHIDAKMQADAVNKLIDLAKPGSKVIIIYSNPRSLEFFLASALSTTKSFLKVFFSGMVIEKSSTADLYFHAHPLKWWNSFNNKNTSVQIKCWRTFSASPQKKIFPSNVLGSIMLKILFFMEKYFDFIFSRFAAYPLIIITKH